MVQILTLMSFTVVRDHSAVDAFRGVPNFSATGRSGSVYAPPFPRHSSHRHLPTRRPDTSCREKEYPVSASGADGKALFHRSFILAGKKYVPGIVKRPNVLPTAMNYFLPCTPFRNSLKK